jgi:hypothetical protein
MRSDSRERRGGFQTQTCLEPHRVTNTDDLTVLRKCDHGSVRRKVGDHGVVVGVRLQSPENDFQGVMPAFIRASICRENVTTGMA